MLIASLVFFTACHKESDVLSNEQKESSSQEYIEFMGKKVLKPSGVDARVFSQVPGEFMNYSIQKYFGSPGGRTLTDVLSTVTLNKFVDIVEEEDKKFPDLSQYPLRATDLDRIKRDLPFIENEQQVRENTDIVFESLLRNDDVANTLSRNIKSSNAGRIASDDYEANPLEKQIGYDNPRLAAATLFGKNEAKKQTYARFVDGSKQNDTKANAFKHAMWNALTIHKCIAYGKSKYGAINDTRTIITAHEYDTDGTGPTGFWNNHFGSYSFSYWFTPGLSHAMDLHNNCLGRNFMQEEVKWGIFGLRSQPGYSEMADRFVQYLNQPSTFQLTNESQILSMYANDWSNLAHLTNAWTYNNAHRDQFAYINN